MKTILICISVIVFFCLVVGINIYQHNQSFDNNNNELKLNTCEAEVYPTIQETAEKYYSQDCFQGYTLFIGGKK